MRKKLIVSIAMLIAALLVGMQYAKKNSTVTSEEVFSLHDNGAAPGWDPIALTEKTKELDDYAINFQIPLNVAVQKGSRSILCVRIPEEFQLVTIPDDSSLHIFIKKEELDSEAQSETIIVRSAPGVKTPSAVLMERLKLSMQEQIQGGIQVLEERTDQYSNYTKSTFVALLGKNGKELSAVRYFSGPYDAGHVQYIITLDEKMTKEKALQKIAKFEKECVEVVFG